MPKLREVHLFKLPRAEKGRLGFGWSRISTSLPRPFTEFARVSCGYSGDGRCFNEGNNEVKNLWIEGRMIV